MPSYRDDDPPRAHLPMLAVVSGLALALGVVLLAVSIVWALRLWL
jgi:hypothetical protein